jgi:hypothetical protein
MPIRFYTTSVSAEKTAREMQQILAQSDARRVAMDFDAQGRPTAIQFVLQLDGRPLPFRIEPDVEGMEKALNDDEDTPGEFDTGQARRVAWRIWKASAHLDQLLLGFGVTQDGRTVYRRLLDDRKLLDAPSK